MKIIQVGGGLSVNYMEKIKCKLKEYVKTEFKINYNNVNSNLATNLNYIIFLLGKNIMSLYNERYN